MTYRVGDIVRLTKGNYGEKTTQTPYLRITAIDESLSMGMVSLTRYRAEHVIPPKDWDGKMIISHQQILTRLSRSEIGAFLNGLTAEQLLQIDPVVISNFQQMQEEWP